MLVDVVELAGLLEIYLSCDIYENANVRLQYRPILNPPLHPLKFCPHSVQFILRLSWLAMVISFLCGHFAKVSRSIRRL